MESLGFQELDGGLTQVASRVAQDCGGVENLGDRISTVHSSTMVRGARTQRKKVGERYQQPRAAGPRLDRHALAHNRHAFVRAYQLANIQSFLAGHVRAFEFFGGVHRRLVYENLKTAVIEVGRGRHRRLN